MSIETQVINEEPREATMQEVVMRNAYLKLALQGYYVLYCDNMSAVRVFLYREKMTNENVLGGNIYLSTSPFAAVIGTKEDIKILMKSMNNKTKVQAGYGREFPKFEMKLLKVALKEAGELDYDPSKLDNNKPTNQKDIN